MIDSGSVIESLTVSVVVGCLICVGCLIVWYT